MGLSFQADSGALYLLESQIRDLYGRVAYSHKTHEKAADGCLRKLARIKAGQIALSAVTTGGFLTAVLGDPTTTKAAAMVASLLSTLLFAINTYTKDNDPGQSAQKHKDAADKLIAIREQYLSLLTDIRAALLSPEEVRKRRDEIQERLQAAYQSSPRTHDIAYRDASTALQSREELTFREDEIDALLPPALRRLAGTSSIASR
jgi:hypothetical protein